VTEEWVWENCRTEGKRKQKLNRQEAGAILKTLEQRKFSVTITRYLLCIKSAFWIWKRCSVNGNTSNWWKGEHEKDSKDKKETGENTI
jgi:hypothetical protein